jgi:hypothetical protein
MQDLAGLANTLHTPGHAPCDLVEAYQPLRDTQRTGDFALIFRDEHAGRRRVWREHNPVLFALDDSVPCRGRVGILLS